MENISSTNPSIKLLVKSKLLDTPQMAELFDIKPNTAEIWRHRGVGPKFVKIGRSVRYRISDLEAYIEAQTRTCTSQSWDSLSHD